jgi:hypothetical protein
LGLGKFFKNFFFLTRVVLFNEPIHKRRIYPPRGNGIAPYSVVYIIVGNGIGHGKHCSFGH